MTTAYLPVTQDQPIDRDAPAPAATAAPSEAALGVIALALAERAGVEVKRVELRRRLASSTAADWRDRLADALRPFGLRVFSASRSLLDLSARATPTPVVGCVGGEPLVVLATRPGALQLLEADGPRWVDVAALSTALALDPATPVAFAAAEHVRPLTRGAPSDHHPTPGGRVLALLRSERSELWVIVVHAMVVGLLSLAVPVAVQSFVSTVAFGTLLQPIVVLALLMLGCLALAGLLRAMQSLVVERLQERVFARAVVELAGHLPRVETGALRSGEVPDPANRLFDVAIVQKTLASLLLDGTAVALSAVLGMTLLAFYHPFLLAFSLVLCVLVATVILGLGRGGVSTAVKESKAKHAVASFLEDVVRNPAAFRNAPDAALERADDLTRDYLHARRAHYRVVFRQIASSLGLQALATAGLLAVGGWLVLERKLTLGQLVAAELVVGTVVAGVAKIGKHLESYYDLAASLDKLGHVLELPTEHAGGSVPLPGGPLTVELEGPLLEELGATPATAVAAGATRVFERGDGAAGIALAEALRGADRDDVRVALGGVDARDASAAELATAVALVQGPEVAAGSVFDNVAFWRPRVGAADVVQALRDVGLEPAIRALPHRTEAPLSSSGAPLPPEGAVLLTLARALAGRPRVLVLDGTLDTLSPRALSDLRGALLSPARGFTLLVTTNRKDVQRSLTPTAQEAP